MTVEDSTGQQKQQQLDQVSLRGILDTDGDIDIPHVKAEEFSTGDKPGGWDEETIQAIVKDGYCVECEDQPAQVHCDSCTDNYCEVCFAAQHRKGTRKAHKYGQLRPSDNEAAVEKQNGLNGHTSVPDNMDVEVEQVAELDSKVEEASLSLDSGLPSLGEPVGEWFVNRAKYIPVRLTLSERKYLRLLEAALKVSEYTDKIDIIGAALSKPKRIVAQIRELCAILSGLVLAADYKEGQQLFHDRDFEVNAEFFQKIFEIGRRHKIMNPDKMRTTYGKLVYILQDSQIPEVREMLGFSCVQPIVTVYSVLEEHGALDLLRDNDIAIATAEIYSENRPRHEINREIKRKEKAVESLSNKFSGNGLSQEAVRQCIHSISDNHSFLRTNRDPCERMIEYLKKYFHPTDPGSSSKASLAIRMGRGGARLSHDHQRQYAYVLQSLTLWKEILHDFFHLWYLAESDLLSPDHSYRLRDTGQGLNRVQPAPKTSRLMHMILNRAQTSIGNWVGSSVIHMGDHNVPNALMFIDKYSQVYRILLPICTTLSQIPNLMEQPALRSYIEDEFGSEENCYREILGDFFRHGFDGSGADNFFDAGSCIDGRLTSAWNWCGLLEKKRYFPVFLLTGFIGFDGEW